MAYIYKIENQVNHKVYIGKTTKANAYRRWSEHKSVSRRGIANHRAIYTAMAKYGIENFSFSVLEEVKDIKKLAEKEIEYIAYYDSYHNGYNETLGGDGTLYLILPEQEICQFYLQNHTIKETCEKFHHDYTTIRRILYQYNIDVIDSHEVVKNRTSKAIAKIDKQSKQILQIYNSIQEAERDNPQCHKHIKDVCHGKRKSAGGFEWQFINDSMENDSE